MIESIMYFGLGFCVAGLSVLIVVPLVHSRAVRLTKRQLETSIPSSLLEVLAEKDLQRAQFAMSTRRLERNVEQLKAGRHAAGAPWSKSDTINRLKIEHGALRAQLHASKESSVAKANAAREAERTLSEKDFQLAELMNAFHERSVLANSQRAEIVALTRQVETLKEKLSRAGEQARAAEDHHETAQIELKAATAKLMEERTKFENFHRRIAELVPRAITQSMEDRIRGRRAEERLESYTVEQSRLLNERDLELKQLRGEIEITRKAEYDLRVAMIENDGRAHAAAQNFKAENARLQAALDRANGERARLTFELANTKRQAAHIQAA
jgi:hypothetical protein